MAEVPAPDEGESEPTTITEGDFEEEFDVGAAAAGEFLIDLGEQLRDGDEVLVTGADWEIPFAFEDTVELEVEFEGDQEPELEIEVELEGRVGGENATSVESDGPESSGADVVDEGEGDEE